MRKICVLIIVLLFFVPSALSAPKDWPAPWDKTTTLKIGGYNPFLDPNHGTGGTWEQGKTGAKYSVDFIGNGGETLYAPVSGRIVCCNFSPEMTAKGSCGNGHGTYGNHIIIKPDEDSDSTPYGGYTFIMAHMNDNSTSITFREDPLGKSGGYSGYRVEKGDQVGYVGRTGGWTDYHLHFELIARPVSEFINMKLFGITEEQFKNKAAISGGFVQNIELFINTTELPVGIVDGNYEAAIEVASNVPDKPYNLTCENLPAGFQIKDNVISGKPKKAGNYSVTLKAIYAGNSEGIEIINAQKVLNLYVASKPEIITSKITDAIVNEPYSAKFEVKYDKFRSGIRAEITPVTFDSLEVFSQSEGSVTFEAKRTFAQAAKYTFELVINDSQDSSVNVRKSFTLNVNEPAPIAPTITTSVIKDGVVDENFGSYVLRADGTQPITWSKSGSLPKGLELSSEGVITGTPTKAGTSTFTIKASNSAKKSASKKFSITIREKPVIKSANPANATDGKSFNHTFTLTKGTKPITWSLINAALPNNFTFDASKGKLSGTPNKVGTFNFTIRAENMAGSDEQNFYLRVNAVKPVIKTSKLPDGYENTEYPTQILEISKGTKPVVWSIASGRLPNDLSLSPEGIVTGTPTETGTFSITFKAENNFENNDPYSGTKKISLKIKPEKPVITTTSIRDASADVQYEPFQLQATGSGITWSKSGNFPSGLSLSKSGIISGTPKKAGTYSFTITAKNTSGSDPRKFTLTVRGVAPVINTDANLPNATVGKSYTLQMQATGTKAITWSAENLPEGVSIGKTNGKITVKTKKSGVFTFTVIATNIAGSDRKLFRLKSFEAPKITSKADLGKIAASAYQEIQLSATGTTPISWTITKGKLPLGLSFSDEGMIKGIPFEVGKYSFTVRASNDVGIATQNAKITVTAPTLTITTSELQATEGVEISEKLAASGTPPIEWSLALLNSLPKNLVLSNDGTITGTPAKSGKYSFTVKAKDYYKTTVSKKITLTVKDPEAEEIYEKGALPNGIIGTPYSVKVAPSTDERVWQVWSGGLPSGIFLSPKGIIHGTPQYVGEHNFQLRATDVYGNSTYPKFTLKVTGALEILTTELPDATIGESYDVKLEINSTLPYIWERYSGSLPTGLFLSPKGEIHGTPQYAGEYNFQLRARNIYGTSVYQDFTINVHGDLEIVTKSLPEATIGEPYSAQLEINSTLPYIWERWGGSLPTGLFLSPKGEIHGTPQYAGEYNFQLRARNIYGTSVYSQTFTINVHGDLEIVTKSLPGANVGEPYSAQLEINSTLPYTWQVYSGSLPTGLFLSPKGEIHGTPQYAGEYNFRLQAENIYGRSVNQDFTINVGGESSKTPYVNLPQFDAKILTESLPVGRVGKYYEFKLEANADDLIWSDHYLHYYGLTLARDGTISGTPTSGTSNSGKIYVYAFDKYGRSASKIFKLVIEGDVAISSDAELPVGTVGKPYKFKLTGIGNDLTWLDDSGYHSYYSSSYNPLRNYGLTLASDGTISGTPTSGTSNSEKIYVKAIDKYGNLTYKDFKLVIESNLAISTDAELPVGTFGKPYKFKLTGIGDDLTWSESPNNNDYDYHLGIYNYSLHRYGLTLAPDGTISGTPTVSTWGWETSIWVEALDKYSNYVSKDFKLVIKDSGLAISTDELPVGTVGKPYKFKLTGIGDDLTWLDERSSMRDRWGNYYEYSLLYYGLTLAQDGTISGTPTQTTSGTSISVRAIDKYGFCSASKEFKLVINGSSSDYATKDGSAAGDEHGNGGGHAKLDDESPENYSDENLDEREKASPEKESPELESGLGVIIFGSERELTEEIANSIDGYEIIAVLPEIRVSESGLYDLNDREIELDENATIDSKLYYFAFSSEPSENDEIIEFYDKTGAEIESVPEERVIKISAWFSAGAIYKPVIAIKR